MTWHVLVALLSVTQYGCGPNLTRPGYKPPADETTRPPLEVFQDAESEMLKNMKFEFPQKNFEILNGIAAEVNRIIRQYPPGSVSLETPQVLQLHIQEIIGNIFLEYMQKRQFDVRDTECVRDYTELCPVGWVDLGDASTCESPTSLFAREECKKIEFGNMTPLEKSNAAFACDEAVYPCRNACKVRNYSQPCPVGWKPTSPGSSVCQVPIERYSKPCVNYYDFTDHNSKMKKKFERICKVVWPCSLWLRSLVEFTVYGFSAGGNMAVLIAVGL